MSLGMHPWGFVDHLSIPNEARQVPLPKYSRFLDWLQKAEVTVTGVDEN